MESKDDLCDVARDGDRSFGLELNMVIGVLGLGMLVGLGTAIAALLNGYSIWMALWFYSSVGTFSALVSIAMLRLIRDHILNGTDEPQS
ncbi:hypothetical protein [Aliiroseovarius sp. F47248L]|uniref:hypothetical protein n=1 Tax=Aliiroseovarius sp. F47248L TaxID=2926420 RepID=UPI001FF4DDC0|nr:hypothetical protein [Aliiroseovarius sp. F47248L]MCK0140565.1 hypothetical protein [Aliiroseovarius sp. F47248L]